LVAPEYQIFNQKEGSGQTYLYIFWEHGHTSNCKMLRNQESHIIQEFAFINFRNTQRIADIAFQSQQINRQNIEILVASQLMIIWF
jgi:hypothetical protein